MPESSSPLKRSGGNVIGTRKMVEKIPCSPSTDQKGLLRRSRRMEGRPSGIRRPPRRSMRRGGRICAEERSGR